MKDNKSAIDLLERVTEGGVHVQVDAADRPERQSSHESIIGGILGADTGSRTHPLGRLHERDD